MMNFNVSISPCTITEKFNRIKQSKILRQKLLIFILLTAMDSPAKENNQFIDNQDTEVKEDAATPSKGISSPTHVLLTNTAQKSCGRFERKRRNVQWKCELKNWKIGTCP